MSAKDSNTENGQPAHVVVSGGVFVIEGEVGMWETDGGFLPYSAEIGGEDIVTKIAEVVDNLPEGGRRGYALKREGMTGKRIRVTIEDMDHGCTERSIRDKQSRAIRDAETLIGEIMRDEVNAQDECEKWLREYGMANLKVCRPLERNGENAE